MQGRMMKGVDDFYYVLVIALVLIAVFSIISAFLPYSPGTGGPPGTDTDIGVAKVEVGTVGYSETEPRSSDLGTFTVGENQEEELRSIPQLEISQGWFGGQSESLSIDVPSYLRDSMRKAIITFYVREANQYGNLNIKWNGKNYYNEITPRGLVTVEINANDIFDTNELEITADGPGLAFWAANVYTLRDFRVNLEYGPAKLIAFQIGSNEIQAFSKGELAFIGFGSSNLRVRINSIKVYDRIPNGVETVAFNYSSVPLKAGNNIIALDSPGGQVTLNNAELKLYVLTNQVARSRTFKMTKTQYDYMETGGYTGEVKFWVESVQRPGDIMVELNGQELFSSAPAQGWNSAYFTSSQAYEGSNTLEFSGTGFFSLGDAEIVLYK